MIKYLFNRITDTPGPSFLPSWQNQNFGKLPQNLKIGKGYFLVVGFPKSGNVWLTSMIADCLELPVDRKNEIPRAYFVHKSLNKKFLYDPYLYRGVALVRDLRDIIVSLFHWLKTDGYKHYYKHGPHQIFSDIETMYIEFFLRRFAQLPVETMIEEYVRRGWPVIKYERLWDQTEIELRRLFDIWRIPVEEERIRSAAEKNRIDMLKKEGGVLETYIERDHFRQGGYGQYKSEIPPHILKDIEKRFGDYLRSWGYETSNS
ncbi:MAG: sulfotransferase domain-containing protein [Syntrophales bacterium]